jgi:hypothetical protein
VTRAALQSLPLIAVELIVLFAILLLPRHSWIIGALAAVEVALWLLATWLLLMRDDC